MIARARVQLTIDILVADSWGPECTVDQVQRQATESAIGALRRGLVIEGMHNPNGVDPFLKSVALIVDDPKVTLVATELERK